MPKKITSKEPKSFNPPMASPSKSIETMNKPEEAPDLGILTNWLTFGREAAKKKQWEWFVIDQFLKGNQDITGNFDTNTLEITQKSDQINFPINKMYSTFRAIKAFVTRHKPKIEVEPEDTTDQSKDYARRANKVIERDNQLNNGRRLNKELAHYGIKYGIGYRQIGYDADKKVTQRWTIDPNHLLIGAKVGMFEDAPYLIKTMVRTVGYWKNKFPDKNIVADDELADSEYQKLALQIQFQNVSTQGLKEEERTALGYECWYRLFKKNKLGGYVNKCLFTKSEILLFEETPYTEYPFVAYRSEVVPNELYADGHMKHIISPQRMLNLLNTQLLEYNHLTNRGRFQFAQGSGFKVVQSKEGQLIIHKPGFPVQVINPPALNPLLERQLNFAIEWIEDLGGQHDASTGVSPERVTSGRAIEALQLGDSNNISDLRDNFEDALSQEAAWILKMYALFEKDGFVLNDKVDDKENKFGVVGSGPYNGKTPDKYFMEDNGTYCDICAILPDNQVKVSVISELGETKEARTELLFRLRDAGLPLKTVLNLIEFPNAADVEQRIAEEALADMAMESMKANLAPQPGIPGGGPPTMPPQAEAPVPTPPDTSNLEAINQQLGGMLNGQ